MLNNHNILVVELFVVITFIKRIAKAKYVDKLKQECSTMLKGTHSKNNITKRIIILLRVKYLPLNIFSSAMLLLHLK